MDSRTGGYSARFGGVARLYGPDGLDRLRAAHVCVVGVGGVGSWTVEALARSGVGTLTLIDLDEVCVSNINRQLPALTKTVGSAKVRVLAARVGEINPECTVHAVEEFFTAESADHLLEPRYSYVVDAIDSLKNKALLIARCRSREIPVITIGGAGGRRDPTAIKIADLALATHDRLLKSTRKLLRSEFGFTAGEQGRFGVTSVFSGEAPVFPQADGSVCAQRVEADDLRLNCNNGFGSATFVTGGFGFAAAAEVVREIASGCATKKCDGHTAGPNRAGRNG